MPITTTGRATDFITFTRTSNATVTDSNGFIKWAGHNLLTNSESFDASVWVKNGVSVSANAFAAPNGTTTADKLIASNTTAVHRTYVTALPDFTKTAVIFARAAEYNFISIGQTTGAYAVVNLTTGAVTQSSGTIPAPVSVGSGWWRIEIPNTTTDYVLSVVDTGTFTADQYGSKSFTGDNTSGVYVWGAHLYRSDLGGMVLNPARGDAYYPTTPRNLLGFTEDFSNAAWTKAGILAFGSGSVANAVTAPNGLQTADLITPDTSNGYHVLYGSSVSLAGGVAMHSWYVKPNGYTKVAIRENGLSGYYGSFSLTGSGSVLDSTATYVTAAVVALSDGWYRISCRITNATSQQASLWILSDSYTTGTPVSFWTPNGTSGIHLWGAQLSDSASLDAYSPVYDAAVTSAAYYAPRLDFDPVTLAARGLLVEELRANVLQHTAALENAAWTKVSSDAATKVASPDGTSSANLVYPTSSTTFVGVRQIIAAGGFTSGVYTISVYAKAAGKNVLGIIDFAGGTGVAAYFTLTGSGTATNGLAGYTQTITPLADGWYRCTMTSTSSWSNAGNLYTWIVVCDAVGSGAVTASGTNGIQMYGVQTELGSFATSYIPNGSAVAGATRTADVASVSTQAFPYSATEGTLVGEVRGLLSNTITQVPLVSFGDANNRIELRAVGDPFTYNRAVVVNSGSTVVDINATGLPASASATRKVGFAFKLNDFATTGTGGTVGTTSSGTIPSVSVMNIGTAPYASTVKTNGWIARITYIPRRLSNSELQARTV